MGKEGRFQSKVISFLKNKGCYIIKYWGGGQFTRSGVPDLLISVNGYFLGVELKAPHGRVSELQLYNLRMINRSGGMGILLYPDNYDAFRDFICDIVDSGYSPKELLQAGAYPFLKKWWNYE